MCKGIVYVEGAPDVVLDGAGATLTYRSGSETYVRRYSRHVWRKLLETELRRLNEWEADERDNVVELRAVH